MTGQPLDPAAIMKHYASSPWSLPYRLAAEVAALRDEQERMRQVYEQNQEKLAALREQVQRVENLIGPDGPFPTDSYSDRVIRAALAGNGAADQSQPECRHTEHAIGVGGRVGRWFESSNDMHGSWERCDR